MFKGRSFPERIQIMLPPPPRGETQPPVSKEAKVEKYDSEPFYVNLSKIREEPSLGSAKAEPREAGPAKVESDATPQEKEQEPASSGAENVTEQTAQTDSVKGVQPPPSGDGTLLSRNRTATLSQQNDLEGLPQAPSDQKVEGPQQDSRQGANAEDRSQIQLHPEEEIPKFEEAPEKEPTGQKPLTQTKPADTLAEAEKPAEKSHQEKTPQVYSAQEKPTSEAPYSSSAPSENIQENEVKQAPPVDKSTEDGSHATPTRQEDEPSELKIVEPSNAALEVGTAKGPGVQPPETVVLSEPETAPKEASIHPPMVAAGESKHLSVPSAVIIPAAVEEKPSDNTATQNSPAMPDHPAEKKTTPPSDLTPAPALPVTDEAIRNLCPVPAVTSQLLRAENAPDKTAAGAVAVSHSPRRIAVTGNPNCGKSTLFNSLTGLRQKVGNYPGVTVEKKEGTFFGSHGEQMQLLDLPGCYSLQARSPDEEIARDVLLGRQPDTPRPDAIVAVLDAANLERNLYLLSQLLELELPVILALNMVDLAENKGLAIDPQLLGQRLGITVIPLVASKGVGVIALRQALSQGVLPLPRVRVPLPEVLEREVKTIADLLPENGAQHAEAALLLGMSEAQLEQIQRLSSEQKTAIHSSRKRLEEAGLDPLSAAVDARYAWISTIIAATVRGDGRTGLTTSDKLDAVLTHRVWGWLAFLAAMSLMFFSIFTIAKLPADWISAGQTLLGGWLEGVMDEGDFRSLVVDGVLAGVAGVLVFLPQILILTFFLGLLEDSGYMARAAFLMDRLMSRVGLHGKSFIPMLSSFACAIPGIMATRTIENRKDRLVTILVAPLMSCSARLPVYTLLIAVLIPEISVFKQAGIMLGMYLIGIVTAFVMAGIFKKTLLRSETPTLLMEMPPYRLPSMRSILTRMQERAAIFLKRAGTVILALSVLLWAMMTYPKTDADKSGSERLAHSAAGQLGKAIEPVIAPLGFDWKIGIGLIGSLAAREVFVSTMGIVYSVENSGDENPIIPLSEVMRKEKRADGTLVYTPLTGTALMVFYVLAMQCLSTLAVVRRETNSWKWPAFLFCYMTLLAYAGSWLVLHVGHLLGWR